MADGNFSLDDILNEYSGGTKSTIPTDSDISVDDIIGSDSQNDASGKNIQYVDNAEKNTDSVKRSAADFGRSGDNFSKNIQPVNNTDNNPERTRRPAVDFGRRGKLNKSDNFEDKYDKLSDKFAKIKSAEENIDYQPAPVPKPDRSFSEKLENDTYGDDEREELREKEERREKKKRLFDKAGLVPSDIPENEKRRHRIPPIAAAEQSSDLKKDNPYDKYAFISEPEKKERSVDDILAEYDRQGNDSIKRSKSENTVHKSFTDIFTRLIPKSSDSDTGSLTNTELLDGMMKMKKERRSRTSQLPPVERKTISDINLNLDGKILPDTAPLPNAGTNINKSEVQKLSELKARRNEKVKDFVLVGDEEEEPDDKDAENESRSIEDFESFEDAPSIATDISQLHATLMLRLLVLIICFAASFYISLANDTSLMPVIDILNMKTQTSTYLCINAIIGIFAAFSSYTVVSCGLSKLFSLKADSDSICALAVVASIAESLVMFFNTNIITGGIAHVYVSAAIGALIFNTIGKLLIVARTKRSFRFISGSCEKYAVFQVEDEDKAQSFTRGALHDFPVLASMRKTEFITDFLKTTYARDSTDNFSRVFTPIIVIASVVVAVLAGITSQAVYGASEIFVGMSAFVGCLTFCSTFSMMLVVNFPMERASVKNSELQGAVIGFDCIDKFAETNSVLIDAAELFPQGSVNLSAIKVFSDMRIDEAIVEAASLTNQSGSILKNMFYDIIAGKTEMLNPVESYIFEDSMGICGWINNKRVLLGNRELMINHSIDGTPTEAKESEYTAHGKAAVYLSISGELSAMFIVDITPSMEVKQALAEMQKNEIYTVIRSVDSLVTINRLSELFEVSPEFFRLVPFRVHKDFEEITSYQPKQDALLACSGRFSALSSLIMSCRNIRGTIAVGIGLQAVSVLLAILICLAMVILRSFADLTATMVITYNMIFAAILLMIQLIRKS